MPASFFKRVGFSEARSRKTRPGEPFGEDAILWKVFDSSAEAPKFLKPNYQFKPVPGKVVVDLFWNTFCQTSNIEAQRVREVVAEFGDLVVINEYPAEDLAILHCYQIPRGIFINGKEIGWGYEAPKEGIREAISKALDS
jgi:thiol-disulfide isomerase/thioredoxin